MDPKCENCHKAVYMAEKVTVDENKAYHIGCFRCSTCKVKLSLGNYTLLDGVLFCKPHFHEAFLSAGAYRAPENSKKTNEDSLPTEENEQGVVSQTSQVLSSQTTENLKANDAVEESSPVAVLQPSHKSNEKTNTHSETQKEAPKKEEKEEDDDENVDPRHRHNLRSVLRSSGQKKNSKRDIGVASKSKRAGSLLQNSSNSGLMKGASRFLHLSHMDSADSLDTYDLVEDISVISSMLKEHQREISAIRAALNRIQENLETI
ncbi:hypothetical protein GpartN1_g5052.t1 [Galdieria partita]|uniref:LIM zinc-binding domain-containing protein n=1 Tax=Galdieria partita TaxID=83374 RepID=A0A9C7Q0H3_9RHOD|nr:hypothetical protein GpartN1_g5052.t1 [Galdieria partita]